MKKFLRITGGVILALGALGGLITFAMERRPEVAVMAIVLAVLAVLLLRPRRSTTSRQTPAEAPLEPQQAPPVSFAPRDVPEDILDQMRRSYGPMQAQEDARIMAESFRLVQDTVSFDTFLMRLDLARQKALTLLQAEQAGCRGVKKPEVHRACESVLASAQSAKVAFLERSYIKETNEALLLKTPSGQRKRLEAYLEKLREHEEDFLDVAEAYEQTVKKVEALRP